MNQRSKRNQVRPANGRTPLWHPTHLGVRPLVRAMAACSLLSFWTSGPQAQGLPTGMNTVAGQVSAKTNGNAMTVTNSPNAIINWKSFSIGAQNSVRFDQVNAASKVLNRVTGNDPSSILGSLSSNGHVWLLNQNGVLFGQGARVDVAGMVASTLNMSDANWLLGRHQFSLDGKPAANVINEGELRTTLGGQIILLGGSVRNEGAVDAPGGQAILAAGSSIELVDTTTPNVGVKITSSPGQVVNLGQLSAAGGRVDIQAAIINQDGIVRADSLARGPGGEIVMRASERLTLAPNSVTSANGDTGGKLTLDADRNTVSGTVAATGAAGAGGQVKLLGREVGLLDAAHVDVSGQRSGGEVLVGGGLQGKDPSVPNAQAVYVGPQASISADAVDSGDGGRVILWSDKATRAFGTFSARGGASGGDGGFIETSGGWLDARPSKVDTSAPHGRSGTWLLDPYNISIINSGSEGEVEGGFDIDFTANADDAIILTGTLESALSSGTQVVVSTGGLSGAQAGNITMNAAQISTDNPGAGASLTLLADGDIAMTNGSSISILGNPTPIALLAGRGGAGSINIDSSTIRSNGGDITLGGFATAPGPFGGQIVNAAVSTASLGVGVRVNSSAITTDGGTISIRGISQASSGFGVSIVQSELTGVDLQVQGSATADFASGVSILNSYLLADRDLSINGLGDIRGVMIVDNGGVTAFESTPQLWVLPPSSAGFLSIGGESLATSGTGVFGVDIEISGQHFSNPAIASWNTGGVSIDGNSSASAGTAIRIADNFVSGVSAPTITAGTGFLRIGALNADTSGAVELDGVSLTTIGSQAIRIAGQYSVSLTNSEVETGGPISIDSNRQILVSNSLISSRIAGNPVTLDSSQSISVDNSTIVSTGGDIRLAGYTLLSGPSGTADFAAAFADSGTGIGVGVSSSIIDAQGGDISIGGGSSLSGGIGVAVTQSALYGANILLQGSAISPGGTGVEIDSSALSATQSILVLGLGDATGVRIQGQNYTEFEETDLPILQVSPSGPGPSAFIQIYGEGRTGGSIGTDIDASLADSTAPIVATGGASVEIYGLSPGTAIRIVDDSTFVQPTIDVVGGGSLTIGDSDANSVVLNGAWLFSEGGITLTGTGALTLDNAALIESDGPIAVSTRNLQTIGNSVIRSFSAGSDAIVLSGGDGAPMATWASTPDSLDAPDGRWLAFLTDVTDTGAYPTTGLAYAFKQYNALPGNLLTDGYSGNGLVFSVQQFATITGNVPLKTYDGTVSAPGSTVGLQGVNGDQMTSIALTSPFEFSDANAGANKTVNVGIGSFEFQDASFPTPKPVYGYTIQGTLVGTIDRAPLTISGLVANNKVYDATTLATLTGSAILTPVLGSDSVSVSNAGTGTFSDKNVGTGKAVTVSGLTLSGTDAGNYILLQPSGLFADISQATLQYVADPATAVFGLPPPAFSGSVAGFKGADSILASTSGTLNFTSDANDQSPPGSYAVVGGGLSATNYRFEQALTNATAFTVVNPPPSSSGPFTAAKQGPTTATDITVTSVVEPVTLITGPSGGLLDLTARDAPKSTRAAAGSTGVGDIGTVMANPFQAVDVASQSQMHLGDLLVARDTYKQNLFAQATTELEQNPGVADVRPCLTLKEIESGGCILTDLLKREWLAAAAGNGKVPATALDTPAAAAAPAPAGPTATSAGQYEPEVARSEPREAMAIASPYEALLGSKRRVMVAALPQIERKVAIVIGVDVYKDPSIPTLSNAVKDARAFGQVLESRLGYETVVLENPGKQDVIAALNKLALAMTPNDSVIIYYAGHGWVVESTKVGYWQLADSDAKQPQTWLSNADIGKLVNQLGATQVALISDSCYSGSLVSNERIRAATKAVDPSEVLAQRTVVVMSSGGNEPVFDSGKNGHSPFAWNLMSTLGDLSDWQAGGSVFERVRFAVAKELPQRPQYGAFATGGGRVGGDYLFERRQLAIGPQ